MMLIIIIITVISIITMIILRNSLKLFIHTVMERSETPKLFAITTANKLPYVWYLCCATLAHITVLKTDDRIFDKKTVS